MTISSIIQNTSQDQHLKYEMINGKCFYGEHLGKFLILESDTNSNDWIEDPIVQDKIDLLKNQMQEELGKNTSLQIRHVHIIYKPPIKYLFTSQKASIGIKFMVWGRANKIKRFMSKFYKSKFQKVWLNGRRKKIKKNSYKCKKN